MKPTNAPAMPGIYLIRNVVSGRGYVGSARNLRVRCGDHVTRLRARTHENMYLQAEFDADSSVFVFDVLEIVHDRNLLADREQFYLDALRTADRAFGYNIRPNARTHSQETCARISAKRKGVPHSPEHTAAAAAGRRGRPLSLETRARMSAAKMGNVPTAETRAKISNAHKGRVFSDEWKRNISIARKKKYAQLREMINEMM